LPEKEEYHAITASPVITGQYLPPVVKKGTGRKPQSGTRGRFHTGKGSKYHHDCILVTNNEKEFSRVDGLKIENWLN
jgi:hypothetical protein